MGEKRYKRGCGRSCLRCWRNKLKHGNKQAKAYLKAHPELDWSVHDADEKTQPQAIAAKPQREP